MIAIIKNTLAWEFIPMISVPVKKRQGGGSIGCTRAARELRQALWWVLYKLTPPSQGNILQMRKLRPA